MSTAVSSRSLIERSDKPHTGCRASQEALLNDKVSPLGIADDCPICLKRNVACEVGCHPSIISTQQGIFSFIIYPDDNLNLNFPYFRHVLIRSLI